MMPMAPRACPERSRRDGHGDQQAEAGELNQKGHHLGPRLAHAQACQLPLDFLDEEAQMVDDGEVMAGAQLLDG